MGKVSYIVAGTVSDSKSQFQNYVTYHQPLGLDGEREGYYKNLVIGECHSVTQKDSVYSSRSTYCKECIHVFPELLYELGCDFITQTCQSYLIL